MNQKNFNLNEKKKSTDINTKMTQMSELSEKDFTAVIKMLQWTMLEINEKKSLNKETESQQRNRRYKEEQKFYFIFN